LAAGHERRTRDGGFRDFIGIDYSGAQTPTASCRNAARHRCSPLPRYRLSVSNCAAKVRASLLKLAPHRQKSTAEKSFFPESETRISIDYAQIHANNWF